MYSLDTISKMNQLSARSKAEAQAWDKQNHPTAARHQYQMKTDKQVKEEIAKLRKLKPIGVWAGKTSRSIALAIEELEHGFDDTAEEYNELTDDQRDMIQSARRWKKGESNEKVSAGWGGLVK